MSRDFTTETISHFVGFFNQILEEGRMRQDYDAFQAAQSLNELPDGLLNVTVNLASDYTLSDFEPGINARISNYSDPRVTPGPPADTLPISFNANGSGLGADMNSPFMTSSFQPYSFGGFELQLPVLPPPSSLALALVQKIELHDNDLLITAQPAAAFTTQDHFNDAIALMAQWAEALSVDWPETLPDSGASIITLGHTAFETAQSFSQPGFDNANIHLLTGDNAKGLHVDGALSDDFPDLDTSMPAWFKDDSPEGHALPHEIITGGNIATNALALSINWIDAPVMAVMGDSHSLSAISQINILSNLDHSTDQTFALSGQDATHNIAALLDRPMTKSNPADIDATEAPKFPEMALVTRLDADLVNFNWVKQYTYMQDHDALSIRFSGEETFLQSGGNAASNLTTLQELGFHYDLIIVGGDLINISIIEQVNILLDNDSVSYGDGWHTSGDGNLLWNEAVIETLGQDSYREMELAYKALGESLASGSESIGGTILQNSAFEGLDALKVLYIDGDLINYQYISQTNIVGDADQLQLHAARIAAQNGTDATIITGENALLNLATIYEVGLNSDIQVGGDHYSDALMYQAGLIVTDENQLFSENGQGLASEAVVFLTDDLSETNTQQDHSPAIQIGDDMTADPMGGVLV